ncbi:MAG: hypothetical protein RL417_1120 [Pseudomonadota bacterium]
MTEFMNIEGDGAQARGRRSQPGAGEEIQQGAAGESAARARRRREGAAEPTPDPEPMVDLNTALRVVASLGHPMRDLFRQFREELKVFAAESNRESGAIGFSHRGPAPVSIAVIRGCCREAAERLEEHIQYIGDGSPRALKLRLLAQAVQTELQEFDIYLTQSSFRGGLVPEGELSTVLTVVNALRGNLGQRLVEFDAVQTSLDA